MRPSSTEAGKFLSYVLRHEPEAIGLALDIEGWASVDALIDAAGLHGRMLDRSLIESIVAGNDKKRFSLSADGMRIRAVQGHSTDKVQRSFAAKTPPALLFHGTARRFLPSILKEGLRPGSRHHVHLSADVGTALEVGRRYGAPVVLTVNALALHRQGVSFHQAENGVWLTAAVPAEALSEYKG